MKKKVYPQDMLLNKVEHIIYMSWTLRLLFKLPRLNEYESLKNLKLVY